MNVRNILVPTDFSSCAGAMLDHAILLAKQHDARLTLLHVVVLHAEDPFDPSHHFPDGEEYFERLQRLTRSELRDLVDGRTSLLTLDVHEVVERGIAPAPTIVAYARDHHSDLIVLGTHGRRGLRHFLLGSVAEEVVRLAPCPVLTVRGDDEEEPLRGFADLVVPYDFSAPADAALAEAHTLAAGYGSRLHLVHVIQPPMDPARYDPLHDARLSYNLGELRGEVEDRLSGVLEKLPEPRVPTTVAVLDGRVASAITCYADALRAGLIVMTTHGFEGVERFFLGSVTEKVVRLARTPVLTLRRVAEPASKEVAA